MNRRLILLLIGMLGISTQIAYAGPANRSASSTASQISVPINLDGFGAPLPGLAQDGSDLSVFVIGQMNF